MRVLAGISAQPEDPSTRTVQFDGLRALAFAAVAFSHWVPENRQFGLPWGTGVQVFFVLSSFLITGILLDHKKKDMEPSARGHLVIWRRFYIRRCLRIFPLFYLVLGLSLIFDLKPIRRTWAWHFSYLSNIYYFRVGQAGVDYFRHFWSLGVEEQFYLFWPFLTLLLPERLLRRVFVVLIFAAPAFRILVNGIAPYHPGASRYLPAASLDALGIGALFALIIRRDRYSLRPGHSLARFCLCAGLPGSLLPELMRHTSMSNSAVSSVVDSIGHSCLVLFYGWVVWTAAHGFPGIFGKVLAWGPLVYLGKISYGLYVFHLLSVPLLSRLIHVPFPSDADLVFRIAGQTALTVCLAVVSWHAFEKPLNGLKRYFPYGDKTSTAAGLACSR